jgi:uncharacterized membrane protein YciS (DUF1049 family)
MTGRHRKGTRSLNGVLFLAGITVGTIAFALFFLAIVLLDKM